MITDDIKNFNKQFAFEPIIENRAKFPPSLKLGGTGKRDKKFVVCGMGGSHLAADILKAWHPELDIVVWSNYGLPPIKDTALKERLVIVSSHSGNTEEAVDAFQAAQKKRLAVAVVAAHGKLIALAIKNKVPYVRLPDHQMQPRLALGFSVRGMLALMGEISLLAETNGLVSELHPAREELRGRDLARRLHGGVPVVYASARNAAVAMNWKIKFNETGKIPAFWNTVPELNHNEMTGFDAKGKTVPLSRHFHFLFLKDADDDRRVTKRMAVLERLFRDRGLSSEVVILHGKKRLDKIFNGLILADWTAYHTAKMYDVEPEQVPMVEEFKKLVSSKQ
jgi:glucose/mannose-6-phosphate isomerase